MLRRHGVKLAAAVGIAWAATIGGTGTASADIWGVVGTQTDTKWDESTADVLYGGKSGNIVGFWQSYLEAYNQLGNCGINGGFNVPTSQGTQNMQNFFGLTPDGVVGDATWDAASRYITYDGVDANYFYWQPAFPADPWAARYQQARGGAFAGYWYWRSYRVNPSNAVINSSSSTSVSFTPGPC